MLVVLGFFVAPFVIIARLCEQKPRVGQTTTKWYPTQTSRLEP
jgi:hypothetical protein